MNQYNFKNNILRLKVKKAPLIFRAIIFFCASAFFVLPVIGVIFDIAFGGSLNIGHFIGVGVFYVIGFYVLRVFLWNTYGNETIEILENKIIYEANYGWFKGGRTEMEITSPAYSFKSVGYEEDNETVLVISSENAQMESVVKMPIDEIKALLRILDPVLV